MVALYIVLLIPEHDRLAPTGAGRTPFLWNQDDFWSELEKKFVDARSTGCEELTSQIEMRFAGLNSLLAGMEEQSLAADAKEFERLEADLFALAPLVAVCSGRLTNYVALAARARTIVKRQSESWDFQSPSVRDRLYRILFGTRMALEQVMLQAPNGVQFPEVALADDEPSTAPSAEVNGLKLRSGDILVSRGGAPTSALIARGNDYPGNFSHVALLHIDEKSEHLSVIESHIECGVTVSSFADYLRDKKLRIMVLRLRGDLPATRTDPLLPHKAAGTALEEAKRRHIPYDFAMDYRDPRKQFCSEVVSVAYASHGIALWLGPTFISSPAVSAWLGSVGVRYFSTQEPSDLEYDPQLRVVAEWRDHATLFKAHVDDAVTDAMLEAAAPGKGLPHQAFLLPFARLSKGYSVVLNWRGRIGPVPEGMTATEALRVQKYRNNHDAIASRVLTSAGRFRQDKGYAPPYWELLKVAKQEESAFRRE